MAINSWFVLLDTIKEKKYSTSVRIILECIKSPPILIPTILFLLSAFFIYQAIIYLGEYQDWGGDFAQYIVQSRNILWGRDWSYYMEGYPAIMPGYPLILAFVASIFGESLYNFALVNSLLWVLVSLFTYYVASNIFNSKSRIFAIFVFALILFNPYVIWFQQMMQPNIAYSFAVWLFFTVFLWYQKNYSINCKINTRYFLLIILLLLIFTGFFRTTFLALIGSFFVYGVIKKNYNFAYLSIVAAIVVISIEIYNASTGNQDSNFEVFYQFFSRSSASEQSAFGEKVVSFLRDFSRMILSYLSSLTQTILPYSKLGIIKHAGYSHKLENGAYLEWHPLMPVFLILFIVGIRAKLKEQGVSVFDLFFVFHLLLISFFIQKGIPKRYVLPILPLFLMYSIYGFSNILDSYSNVIKKLTVLCFILVTVVLLTSSSVWRIPQRHNVLDDEFVEATNWIKSKCGEFGAIGFFKPRTLIYVIDDINGCKNKVFVSRGDVATKKWLLRDPGRNVVLVLKKYKGYNQKVVYEALMNERDFVPIWQNNSYAIVASK